MELKDYTTEELKAELARRNREEGKTNYEYAKGRVVSILHKNSAFSSWRYVVDIFREDIVRLSINPFALKDCSFAYKQGAFNKTTAPKEGDIVLLQKRITKNSPKFYLSDAKVCEIVKE